MPSPRSPANLSLKSAPDVADAVQRMPAALQPLLALIQKQPYSEVEAELVQFVCAFSDPDMVCNLAILENIPFAAKEAAIAFFTHCLLNGLSLRERFALLQFVRPYITATLLPAGGVSENGK